MTRLVSATLALSLSLASWSATQAEKYNFVLIMADDLGANQISPYSDQGVATPHLEQMARQGMQFDTCYATPNCSVTRMMLMTGRYGFRTGWCEFLERPYSPQPGTPQFDIGAAEITFADLLKRQGYVTGIAGKWQLPGSPEDRIFDCGFDTYRMWRWKHPLPDSAASTDPQAAASLHLPKKSNRYWDPEVIQDAKRLPAGPDDFGPDLYCDFVCDFIRQNREKPFLIYYSMTLIHKHNRQFPDAPDFEHPGRRLPPTPESSVRYIDHLVGRITETVDRLGLQENTFVLFTSDNGPADHGKNQTVEQGVRVPLIVRGPGIAPGAVSSELVSLVDVYPTLVELSGGALPKDRAIDGVSMAPVWFDRPGKRRDWLFSYQGPNRMLRDKRWLLQGTGEFLDCGENRDGKNYRNVTNSKSPEVVAARERFAQILQQLPAPQLDPSATQRTRKSK